MLASWCLLLLATWGGWLWQLDIGNLTFDETATYFVANRPFFEILDYLRGAVQEHPPVYYLLIRGWMVLLGTSEFSLRLFAVVAGLIALPLSGWMARQAARRRPGVSPSATALATAVLLAATPGIAYYARDARMYSLMLVWVVLAAGLFLRDWLSTTEWPRKTAVLTLIMVNGLALFTHYYLILPILMQPLVLLLGKRWRPFWAWSLSHSLPGLLGLAWLWLATGLQMSVAGNFANARPTMPDFSQVIHLVDRLLFSPLIELQPWRLTLLAIMIVGGLLVTLWQRWRIGVWLLAMLPGLFGLAYLLPAAPQPRYILFLIPFALLAIVHVLLLPMRSRRLPMAGQATALMLVLLTAGLLVNSGFRQVLTLEKSRYGYTVATVQAHARPGDEVLFYGPWQIIPFHYYDPGEMPPITMLPPHAPPVLNPAEAEPVLEALLDRADRLWVIPVAVDNVDPRRFVANWLRTNSHAVWRGPEFDLYMPPLPDDTPGQSLALTWGQSLLLAEIRVEAAALAAGEPFRLALNWHFLQPMPAGAELALSLADEAGTIWAINHATLAGSQSPAEVWDRLGLMLPAGAPPGDYSIRLRVVDLETGSPLLVDGQEQVELYRLQLVEPSTAPVLNHLPQGQDTRFCAPDSSLCLGLATVEPGGIRFQPDFPVPLTTHWLAPDADLPELAAQFRITPESRWPWSQPQAILTETLALVSGYPAAEWSSGRLVSWPMTLQLPANAPAGRADVTVAIMTTDGRFWQTGQGNTNARLFQIIIEERPTVTRLPAGLSPLQVTLGEEIELRGYRITGEACPGSQIQISYAWYASGQPGTIYSVFNHLFAPDGSPVTQTDGWPQEGRLLTTQWQPGEYIEDIHRLTITEDAPPGPYTLYVGMYDAADGVRLPLIQDGERLHGDQLPIAVPANCP
jgi:mannosyltransferase